MKNKNSKDERKIILPMAEHLSEKLNAPYFEVSLHTGENVKLIFQTIAELVYKCKEGENWMDFSKQLIKNHAPPVQESPTIQNEGKKTEEKRIQAPSKESEVQSRESEKRPIELEMMREEERTAIPLGVFAMILDNRRHPFYTSIIPFPVYNVPNENRRHKEAVILSSLKKREEKKKEQKKIKKKKGKEEKRKRKQKFEPLEPLANQLGIPGTSYRVQSGHINGKKALRVLKGNDVIDSFIFTDKDLGEYDYLFKIIVLGDGDVGKTALALRFSKGFFTEDNKMTIGVDFHIKTITIDTNDGPIRCKLQAWDTGGQERFSYIRPMYYRGFNGVILVFDLTNFNNFTHLSQWINEIKVNLNAEVPILLVGNKSDLVDKREVNLEDIKLFAEKFNIFYVETSAKTGEGVNSCFYILAHLMTGGRGFEGGLTPFHQIKPDDLGNPGTSGLATSDNEIKEDYFGGGDDRIPYPYIYNPPEPPDDIDPALQSQRKVTKPMEEPQAEQACPYCGFKLPKGQKYCPICGKDVF